MYFHGIIRQQVPNKSFFFYISFRQHKTEEIPVIKIFLHSSLGILLELPKHSLIHAANYLVHVVNYLVHAVDYLVHAVDYLVHAVDYLVHAVN